MCQSATWPHSLFKKRLVDPRKHVSGHRAPMGSVLESFLHSLCPMRTQVLGNPAATQVNVTSMTILMSPRPHKDPFKRPSKETLKHEGFFCFLFLGEQAEFEKRAVNSVRHYILCLNAQTDMHPRYIYSLISAEELHSLFRPRHFSLTFKRCLQRRHCTNTNNRCLSGVPLCFTCTSEESKTNLSLLTSTCQEEKRAAKPVCLAAESQMPGNLKKEEIGSSLNTPNLVNSLSWH